MSSDYDPHEYGLVKLGSDAGSAAKKDEKEESISSPEDILFEEDPALRSESGDAGSDAGGDDEGWGALGGSASYIGSDEAFPVPEEPPPAPQEPEPKPEPAEPEADPVLVTRSDLIAEPPAEPVKKKPRPASSAKSSGARARLTARPPRIAAHRMARPHRPSGWMVPIVVFTLSAGMSATMFLFFQNVPLAALSLSMGVIGSLFTRVLLR